MKKLVFLDQKGIILNFFREYNDNEEFARFYHNLKITEFLSHSYEIIDVVSLHPVVLEKRVPDVIITNIPDKPNILFGYDLTTSREDFEKNVSNYFIHDGGLFDIMDYHNRFPGVKVIAYADKMPKEFSPLRLKGYGVDRYIERPEVYDGIEKVMSELEAELR